MTTDRECMLHAIDLARKCKSEAGKVSPRVGAVIARDGVVLGEAYRGELTPGDHAEYTLLHKKLEGEVLAKATLFTTLEPCISRGDPKIPCADRIIERQIGKVFIGVIDSNTKVQGEGELKLREAGVDIARFDSDLMPQLEELNRDFTRQHRPVGRWAAKDVLPNSDPGSVFNDPRLWYALSNPERETYTELVKQDETLAGLFLFGLQLTARRGHAGVGYMIGHCGRELCKGVVHLLAGAQAPPASAENDEKNRSDAFATLAARAFGYPKETAIIREWAELQIFFNSVAHLRPDTPESEEIAKTFFRLTDLIHGVIAPYFATHEELKRVLQIETPTDADEERVRAILSRSTLRRIFFSSLQHPAWLVRLKGLRVFELPPMRNVNLDGSWSLVAWPEGEYLARVAKNSPELVRTILRDIPTSNDNPVVWDLIARTASELATYDSVLTQRVIGGIKAIPHLVLDDGVRALLRRAAAEHDENAFVLLDTLLAVAPGQPSRREPFARIETYAATLVLSEGLPELLAFDGVRLLRSLLAKLYRIVEKGETLGGETYSGPSRIWCRTFDVDIARADDGRMAIALTTAKVACAVFEKSEELGAEAFALLGRAKSEASRDIGSRIRYYALARGSPNLRGQVESLLSDPDVLSPRGPRREIGDVLRLRFEEGSTRSQLLFKHTIMRGPDASALPLYLERQPDGADCDEEPLTDERVAVAVKTWQRRELSRFRGKLPIVLRPLAEELGVTGDLPDERELALVEDGWWSGGAHWVGHASPVSPEDMANQTPAQVIELVSQWSSRQQSEEWHDLQGILQEIRKAIASSVEWAGRLCTAVLSQDVPVILKAAVLDGLRGYLTAGGEQGNPDLSNRIREFPWQDAFALMQEAFEGAPSGANAADVAAGRAFVDAAISLIEAVGIEEVVERHRERLWQLLVLARDSSLAWQSEAVVPVRDVESILLASLNTLSGRLVQATLHVALAEARSTWPVKGEQFVAAPALSEAVSNALTSFLQKSTEPSDASEASRIGALATMGEYAAQIAFLNFEWLRENFEKLFSQTQNRSLAPAWAAYITRARFSSSVFALARPFYLSAARSPRAEGEAEGRWSVSEGLAQHILISVLQGATVVGVDELATLVFTNAPASNRAHAYWATYRSWEDHEGVIDAVFIARARELWAWRLDQLESVAPSAERSTEAEGLLWFFLTSKVPAELSLELALRTVLLLDKKATGNLSLLERLASTSEQFPDQSYEIAEAAINLALSSPYPYIPTEPVIVILKAALTSSNPTLRKRATEMVNKLGEDTGDASYGDLLG